MGLYIDSETSQLKRVLIHSPGKEIELMTPKAAEQVLYKDIIPRSVVEREYSVFKAVLETVAEVFELSDLLRGVLQNREDRERCIDEICRDEHAAARRNDLLELSADGLADTIICGLPPLRDTLTRYLSQREFDIPPLPNMYFTRDCGMVFRDTAIVGAMAHPVRRNEAVIAEAVFSRHADFAGGQVFSRQMLRGDERFRLEGGDLLVARSDLLLIGLSERTSSEAVDSLCTALSSKYGEPLHVVAVILPRNPSTIHLDMIFTFLGTETALVHEPLILGRDRLPVVRMDVFPDRENRISRPDSLLAALKDLGMELQPVVCGGEEDLRQRREQWLSGTNVFAIDEGKVIGYDCNVSTLEALNKAGFAVVQAADLLSGKETLSGRGKVVIGTPGAELARGGGGIRCMTLPVEREVSAAE
jgi:arginine deiminase